MAFTIRKTLSEQEAARFIALFEENDEDPRHAVAVVAEHEWDLWLAESANELAGGVLTRTQPDEAGQLRGGIDNLLVDGTFRRQGAGRQLMRTAEDYFRGAGLIGIQLAADADNAPALGLYDSLGYRVVAHYVRRRTGLDGAMVDTPRVRMWKDFEAPR